MFENINARELIPMPTVQDFLLRDRFVATQTCPPQQQTTNHNISNSKTAGPSQTRGPSPQTRIQSPQTRIQSPQTSIQSPQTRTLSPQIRAQNLQSVTQISQARIPSPQTTSISLSNFSSAMTAHMGQAIPSLAAHVGHTIPSQGMGQSNQMQTQICQNIPVISTQANQSNTSSISNSYLSNQNTNSIVHNVQLKNTEKENNQSNNPPLNDVGGKPMNSQEVSQEISFLHSKRQDFLNAQNMSVNYRDQPSLNIISPSSIPNPSPSVKQSPLKGPFPSYGSFLYSIPGFSAFQPVQGPGNPVAFPVATSCSNQNAVMNQPVSKVSEAGMNTSQMNISNNVKIPNVGQSILPNVNLGHSIVNMQHGTKIINKPAVTDKKELGNPSKDESFVQHKAFGMSSINKTNAIVETDFEEKFLTTIVPQAKKSNEPDIKKSGNTKSVQIIDDKILKAEERFSLKTSIPISKIDMRSIHSHPDLAFVKSMMTSKEFLNAETKEAKSKNILLEVKDTFLDSDTNKSTALQENTVTVDKDKILDVTNSSFKLQNVTSMKSNIYKARDINEPSSEAIVESKFNVSSNLGSFSAIPHKVTTDNVSSRTNRPVVTAKSLIDQYNMETLKNNKNASDIMEQKKKFVFMPSSGIHNPKLMLAISPQKPGNNSILLTKNKVQEERVPMNPMRLQSLVKKPKESLLLTDAVTENKSKVVALKRLHHDNIDENDFENLITENQIYGSKIVVKEKANIAPVQESLLLNAQSNTKPKRESFPLPQEQGYIVQPNFLYLSNVQLQPSNSNFMVLGNKTIYPQLPSIADAVNNNDTSLSTDTAQQDHVKILQSGQFRTLNSIQNQTVSTYFKSNNNTALVEAGKQNNVLQTLLNKPVNCKASESLPKAAGQRLIGQIVNNQIVYQVPMVIERENIPVNSRTTLNVCKSSNSNNELTFLLSKNSQQNENMPKTENKIKFQGFEQGVNSTSDTEVIISSIDLAEKRRRLKRKKKMALRHPAADGKKENSSFKVVGDASSYSKASEKYLGKLGDKFYDEWLDDSDSQSDEEDLEVLMNREKLWITKGPAIPLDAPQEKLEFLNIFGLTTKSERNDIELQKTERSVMLDRICFASMTLPAPSEEDLPREPPYTLPVPPQTLTPPSHSQDAGRLTDKIMFFNELHLGMVSKKYRSQHEQIWNTIVKDRKRRNGSSALLDYFEESFIASNLPKETNIVKKKDDSINVHARDQLEIMTAIQKSVTQNNNLIKKKFDGGTIDKDEFEISLLAEKNFSEITKLSKMANRSLNILGRQQDAAFDENTKTKQEDFKVEKLEKEEFVAKINIPTVPKIISLKSSLDYNVVDISPATSMDEPQNSAAGLKESPVKVEEKGIKEMSTNTELMFENAPVVSVSCKQLSPEKSSAEFRWPGVEAVVESYRRFSDECEAERARLSAANIRLELSLSALRAEAGALGQRLRAQLGEARACEAQGGELQRQLNTLTACIHTVRQT